MSRRTNGEGSWGTKTIKGYAINEKRLAALNKTVEIQSKIIADTLEIEEVEVLRAVKLYIDALVLLDQYDHQSLNKPEGNEPVYRIMYTGFYFDDDLIEE